MSEAVFLPKVLEYDRYQPEFYENTFTYIKKRTSKNKVKQGLKLYKKEKIIIEKIENEFNVEKELLLALMGIETNFGKYLGKMDIISSLATATPATIQSQGPDSNHAEDPRDHVQRQRQHRHMADKLPVGPHICVRPRI